MGSRMMTRVRRGAIALVAFACLALPAIAGAAPVVVILNDGQNPTTVSSSHGLTVTKLYDSGVLGFAANVSSQQRTALSNDSRVLMVADDETRSYSGARFRGVRMRGVTSESRTAQNGSSPIEQIAQITTRGLKRIGGDKSKTADIDGKGPQTDVDIAVLDSGIQPDQPDLRVAGGVDCSGHGGWDDVEGHGTIVAGIAAAKDNKFGIVGAAPGARLWSVKVLDENLEAEDSEVLCGIAWVTKNAGTIDVANMSLTGEGFDDKRCGARNDDVIHFAICRSVAKGVTYVAGAGNDGVNARGNIPVAYDEVIGVSAMVDSDGKPGGRGGPDLCQGYADDTFAPFSNYGAVIDLSAPGVCVSSTFLDSDVAVDSGTSYAAPFVSGAAALYIASDKGQRKLVRTDVDEHAAVVRDALLDDRERGRLRGDGDLFNEGIVDVSGI